MTNTTAAIESALTICTSLNALNNLVTVGALRVETHMRILDHIETCARAILAWVAEARGADYQATIRRSK